MPRPRKPTPNQQAWQKEVARLERAVKRAEKQGRVVPPNFIPPTPKRITKKKLSLIKSITLKPERPKKEAERKPPTPKRGADTRRTRVTAGETPTARIGRKPPRPKRGADTPRTRVTAGETPTVRTGRKPARAKTEESKEKDRIRSTIYRAKKRGYETPSMQEIMAAKPSGITDLDYLRSLKGNKLYELFRYAIYTDPKGNVVYQTGAQRRAEENWARAQLGFARHPDRPGAPQIPTGVFEKPPEVEPDFEPYAEPTEEEVLDAVTQYIAHLYQQIEQFERVDYWPEDFYNNKVQKLLDLEILVNETVAEDGEYAVALRIANGDPEFFRHVDVILYSSDEGDVEHSWNRVAEVIKGRPLTAEESEALTEDN